MQNNEREVSDNSIDESKPTSGVMSPPDVNLSGKVKDAATAADLLQEIINMGEDEFLPWEEITLPSKGMYYSDKLPGGIVRVRPMGIHADKILATQRLAQSGQSIDYLYKHCVQLTDGFDPVDLLSGDRIFLLYVLRGITHGNIYEFMIKCSNCDTTSSHTYDLNELAATIRYPDLSIGDEPFKVPLPQMSQSLGREVWVKVRFMRGRDISAMANRAKFTKRVHGTAAGPRASREIIIDQTVTDNLALVMQSFGGAGATGEVSDQIALRAMVERMHSKDTAIIRQFLREKSPGIDTTINVSCPECAFEYQTELPITESFFRPTSDRPTG